MAAIQHVLVAVDLGAQPPLALAKAVAIAAACRARLTVVHACKSAVDGLRRLELRNRLSDLVRAQYSAPLDTHLVVLAGDPAAMLLAFARANEVDLVVVGRHHHGAFRRLLFESPGEVISRDAPCAVLAVHEPAATAAPDGASGILCAVDLMDGSAATLDLAASFAGQTGAPLTVLHVIENWSWSDVAAAGAGQPAALGTRLIQEANERLRSFVSQNVPAALDVKTLISFGVPPIEIVHEVSNVGANILVIGARTRRVLGSTVLGSTASYALVDAPCSILLARPGTARRQESTVAAVAELSARG